MAIYCLLADKLDSRSQEILEEKLAIWPLAKNFLTANYSDYARSYPASAMITVDRILRDNPNAATDFFSRLYRHGNTLEALKAAASSHNEVLLPFEFYCW